MKEDKFSISDEILRPYFALPNVLDGLFALIEKLFGVQVEAADGEAPVWHKDVRFFKILENGEPKVRRASGPPPSGPPVPSRPRPRPVMSTLRYLPEPRTRVPACGSNSDWPEACHVARRGPAAGRRGPPRSG